ncbi:hypothetical protein HAX54_037013 [Datura stramonium]|uniref:Uncharacterized protein n=1 Tax=Datura stramonium TaxID=4076 RepID=A0ABS8SGM1_DATST|nr:hypothetical protein [Datura stramonium]
MRMGRKTPDHHVFKGNKGSFKRGFHAQSSRPGHATIHASKGGHSGRGSYSSNQGSQSYSQRPSACSISLGYSGSSQQMVVPRSYYSYGDPKNFKRDCPHLS